MTFFVMAGAAAAGFIIRSLEAMLKECAGKKYPALQSSVQTCLGWCNPNISPLDLEFVDFPFHLFL